MFTQEVTKEWVIKVDELLLELFDTLEQRRKEGRKEVGWTKEGGKERWMDEWRNINRRLRVRERETLVTRN